MRLLGIIFLGVLTVGGVSLLAPWLGEPDPGFVSASLILAGGILMGILLGDP